jgi:WD40 repeat protein
MWGRVALTPDGSRVAMISYQFAFIADLTAARPRYVERPAPEGFSAIQFAPDGSRLLALTFHGEVRALNPNTLAAEVVRRDAFDGMPDGYGPPTEMAVSGTGSAVLLRRESYYPRRVSVRHVPLPTGKVVELHLPDWHRATTLAYSPDGRHAVTAESESGWVGFWDVASGKSLGFVRAVLEDLAWRSGQVEFAPDSSAVAVSYNTGHKEHGSTVAVWPWPEVLAAAGA